MKCDKELVTHWLNNQMTENQQKEFELHLSECVACRQDIHEAKKVLRFIDQIPAPEPSSGMDARFQGMLDMYKQSVAEKNNSGKNLIINFYRNLTLRPTFQLGYSIVLIAIGAAFGYLLLNKGSKDNSKAQLVALTSAVEDMRQVMLLSLLENSSASARLRGVNYAEEISNINDQVIDALFTTLNEDPNVNVRLVTLEALTRYSTNAAVREGLVLSIVQQESPLVQSALADVMLNLQEKQSIKAFKLLLKKKKLTILSELRLNTLSINLQFNESAYKIKWHNKYISNYRNIIAINFDALQY